MLSTTSLYVFLLTIALQKPENYEAYIENEEALIPCGKVKLWEGDTIQWKKNGYDVLKKELLAFFSPTRVVCDLSRSASGNQIYDKTFTDKKLFNFFHLADIKVFANKRLNFRN